MLNTLLRNFRWHRTADKWGPRRLVVLEIGPDATRLATVSRESGKLLWETARLVSSVGSDESTGESELTNALKTIGPEAQYVSLVLSGGRSFVRLLNFPGQVPRAELLTSQVRQTLGVDESFEVRHEVIRRSDSGDKNAEYAVLACALPRQQVDSLQRLILDAGRTPVSFTAAGVAVANLAEATPGVLVEGHAVGFLQIGLGTSMLLLYDGANLALARQFKLGIDTIVESLMSAFDLDYATACKLFNSGSFDFSGNVSSSVNTWLHQVSISLDFIERRYGHPVETLNLLGAGAGTNVLREIFTNAVRHKIETWDAFSAISGATPPKDLEEPPELYALALCEAERIMRRGFEHES